MRVRPVMLLSMLPSLFACEEQTAVVSGTALVGVGVVDLEDGRVRPGMTVVVDGRRITHVEASKDLRLDPAVRRIELDGTYVTPGLWDMHAHTWADEEARAVFLPAFVAHGITGIRDMFADCHRACAGSDSRDIGDIMEFRHPSASMVRSWQEDVAARRTPGPRIVRSSYIIAGEAGENPFPTFPSSRVVHGVEDARAAVVQSASRGVDFIKIFPTLSRDEFFEIVRVADSLSLPLAGHVPDRVTPVEASDAGMDSFEHGLRLAGYCAREPGAGESPATPAARLRLLGSPAVCAETFARMAANGTRLVPTLTVMRAGGELRSLDDPTDPRRRYLPAHVLALWDRRSRDPALPGAMLDYAGALHDAVAALLPAARDAGVIILAGSDTPNPYVYPGEGLVTELEELVRAGLTPLEVLRAATVEPVRFLGLEDDLGGVAPGKLADLAVFAEDPLDDVGHVRTLELVVADGRVYTRTDLDRLLADMERYSAAAASVTDPPGSPQGREP